MIYVVFVSLMINMAFCSMIFYYPFQAPTINSTTSNPATQFYTSLCPLPSNVLNPINSEFPSGITFQQNSASAPTTTTNDFSLNLSGNNGLDLGLWSLSDLSPKTQNAFTIASWVNLSQLGGISVGIISKTTGNVNAQQSWATVIKRDYNTGGTPRFNFRLRLAPTSYSPSTSNYTVIDLPTKSEIPLNTWVHLAVTFLHNATGNYLQSFVNGNLDNYLILPGADMVLLEDPSSRVTIGGFFGASGWTINNFLSGNIDEIMIFDTRLSAADIKQLMSSAPYPIPVLAVEGWSNNQDPIYLAQNKFNVSAVSLSTETNLSYDWELTSTVGNQYSSRDRIFSVTALNNLNSRAEISLTEPLTFFTNLIARNSANAQGLCFVSQQLYQFNGTTPTVTGFVPDVTKPATFYPGQAAVFSIQVSGQPPPVVSWQIAGSSNITFSSNTTTQKRQSNTDGEFTTVPNQNGNVFTINSIGDGLNNSQVRAVITNSLGTFTTPSWRILTSSAVAGPVIDAQYSSSSEKNRLLSIILPVTIVPFLCAVLGCCILAAIVIAVVIAFKKDKLKRDKDAEAGLLENPAATSSLNSSRRTLSGSARNSQNPLSNYFRTDFVQTGMTPRATQNGTEAEFNFGSLHNSFSPNPLAVPNNGSARKEPGFNMQNFNLSQIVIIPPSDFNVYIYDSVFPPTTKGSSFYFNSLYDQQLSLAALETFLIHQDSSFSLPHLLFQVVHSSSIQSNLNGSMHTNFANISENQLNQLATALITIYSYHGKATDILKHFITTELTMYNSNSTIRNGSGGEQTALWRRSSGGMKMWSVFAKMMGNKYLWDLFALPIHELHWNARWRQSILERQHSFNSHAATTLPSATSPFVTNTKKSGPIKVMNVPSPTNSANGSPNSNRDSVSVSNSSASTPDSSPDSSPEMAGLENPIQLLGGLESMTLDMTTTSSSPTKIYPGLGHSSHTNVVNFNRTTLTSQSTEDGTEMLMTRNTNYLQVRLIAQKFIDGIFTSNCSVPLPLKTILLHVRNSTLELYSDHEIAYKSLGVFFFLRFICPALLSPSSYGLMGSGFVIEGVAEDGMYWEPEVYPPLPPTEEGSKELGTLGKLIQNLANGTLPGAKEPVLDPLNDFVVLNSGGVKDFLDELCEEADFDVEDKKAEMKRERACVKEENYKRCLGWVYDFVRDNEDQIIVYADQWEKDCREVGYRVGEGVEGLVERLEELMERFEEYGKSSPLLVNAESS